MGTKIARRRKLRVRYLGKKEKNTWRYVWTRRDSEERLVLCELLRPVSRVFRGRNYEREFAHQLVFVLGGSPDFGASG